MFISFLQKYCPQTSNTFRTRIKYSPIKVGDVIWNFESFLINKEGKTVKRFNPEVDPLDLKEDIKQQLAK